MYDEKAVKSFAANWYQTWNGMELAFASASKETFMKNDLGSSFRDESQVEVKKKKCRRERKT